MPNESKSPLLTKESEQGKNDKKSLEFPGNYFEICYCITSFTPFLYAF